MESHQLKNIKAAPTKDLRIFYSHLTVKEEGEEGLGTKRIKAEIFWTKLFSQ